MPVGIQVWDESGALIVDTSDFFVKTGNLYIGQVSSPGAADFSSYAAAGAIVTPIVENLENAPPPVVTEQNGVIRWDYQPGSPYQFKSQITVMMI